MPINSFLYPGAKVTPAYEVANSCRFNSGSSDNLSISLSSTATNTKKGTLSFWFKTQGFNQQYPIAKGAGTVFYLYFNSSNQLVWQNASTNTRITNQVFRDPTAWSNLVVNFDTTQSTASNRQKMYFNGVEITSFGTSNDLSLNQSISIFDGDSNTRAISGYVGGGYWDGYMCEVVGIDGEQLDATSFGEFDEDSPTIWKPKDVSGLTFGNNGFYLDFEDSSALGNDVSGNNNDFTVNNLTAIDQATDTPTNNFCTLNPLNFGNGTLSEGNLKWTTSSQAGNLAFGTIGIDMDVSNQFYWETKIEGGEIVIGIAPTTLRWNDTGRAGSYGYYSDGNKYSGTSASSYGASFTTNDIIGVLVGNGTLTFYKNGASQGTAFSSLSGTYLPFLAEVGSTNSMNFGSPPYSISSGNSDPAGYGNFEYSTNSGYALNTKNLAEFG